MKFLVSILMMIAICVQALPAESQEVLRKATPSAKESDEWAKKIENIINLYAAEEPRRPIMLEDVKDYSLEELFIVTLKFNDSSVFGDQEKIFQFYKNRAVKAKHTRHIKLAHIMEVAKKINFIENDPATLQLNRYVNDDDYFVSFTALNFRLQNAVSNLGGKMEDYIEVLDSYIQIRTLLPSPSHIHYEYYRYRDAIVSEALMVLGGNMKSAAEVQQEAHYFAKNLGLDKPYYDTAHNLILLHSNLYGDENSKRLAQKLYDATKRDAEHNAYASYLLSNLLIKKGDFKEAVTQVQKMKTITSVGGKRVYYSLLYRSHLYSGNLEDAKLALDNYFKITNASEQEIENHKLSREFNLIKESSPVNKANAIAFIAQNYADSGRHHQISWNVLTKPYIHSLGIPHHFKVNNVVPIDSTALMPLPQSTKAQISQAMKMYKTPNILTEIKTGDKYLNPFDSLINRVESTPSLSKHYLQNSDFYQTLLTYDYSQSLIFQHSKYNNITPPKISPEVSKEQRLLLQIDIFNAVHYLYMNDIKMAWQTVADITAEIVKSEDSLEELEYQLEYVKFLLFTKENNLYLATIAANNHIAKAIELKRPVNESSILENFVYLLYQNNYFDEALTLLDDIPRLYETGQHISLNIEYLKAMLLTQTGQHAAALSHAQIHNSEGNSDEHEALFGSLKYLNQAAMGDIKNAKITKQLISTKLSRISNTTVQNTAHLNIAKAQIYLQEGNAGISENSVRNLASTLEQNRQIEIVKLRAERDLAGLKKDVRLRDHLNSLLGTIEDKQLDKNIAYVMSALLAFIMMVLGVLYFKKKHSFNRMFTVLNRNQKKYEKIYQHLSSASNERVSAIRRILSSVKDTHIDEATIHNLSVAIDEADALLGDIKRTKIRSRLASSLDGASYSMFDPHRFRSTMVPIWMQKVKSKNVTFTFNCDANLGAFETDAEILIAAVEETVMKAINTTLFGSIIVEFNVSRKLNNHLLSINITDTGNASQNFNPDDVAVQAIAALNGSFNHSCESGIGCNVKITLPIKLSNPRIKTPQNNNVVNFKN